MTLSRQQIHYAKYKTRYLAKNKQYRQTKRGHLTTFLSQAKKRAQNKGIPFDLDLEYLMSIATDECPVFGIKFVWGRGLRKRDFNGPSLDRIVQELGYVKGNVVFISFKANMIKQDVTEKELYAVADWLHDKRKEVMNAFKIEPTSVPEGSYIPGAVGNELGSISTPWTWEDGDDTHHHCGADARQDSDRSTETSSGDSVGRGDK